VIKQFVVGSTIMIALAGCSSFLKYDKTEQLNKNDEFEKAVKVEKTEAPVVATPEVTTAPVPGAKVAPAPVAVTPKAPAKKEKAKPEPKKKSKKAATVEAVPEAPAARQPDLEDTAGFEGRRPVKDPFRVGEVVTHDVHYFKVSAGEMKLKVEPFVIVNGRKSYNFTTAIKTVGVFSNFYSVEDKVETYVDYENLTPYTYELHVKESGQLREAKMLFDNVRNIATFWEKKVTKKDGEEEKKQKWDIMSYSQNVFSAVFYLRVFQWEVGKEYAFRVANDNENLVFTAKALRKEVLDTALGPKNAIVIQPQIKLKGDLKPIGDIFIWLSDDEHKYILRIESKIKIGTLISEVVDIK
jgi:hypothetical protein